MMQEGDVIEDRCEDRVPLSQRRPDHAHQFFGTAKSLGMPPLDFKAMHEMVLPQRLRRGVSDLIAWDVAGAAPMALQTPDGNGYSYICDNGRVRIVPGVVDDATLVIELPADSWTDYYYELR